MSQIEVPDWVVEVACHAAAKARGNYLWPEEWMDGDDATLADETRATIRAAITAALGAWVVPEKFQVRTRCPFFGWGHWYSIKSQQERDDHFNRMNMGDWMAERRDLYTLRQEKPE